MLTTYQWLQPAKFDVLNMNDRETSRVWIFLSTILGVDESASRPVNAVQGVRNICIYMIKVVFTYYISSFNTTISGCEIIVTLIVFLIN